MFRTSLAVLAALVATTVVSTVSATPASAKVPGKTYCFNGVCHRVNTIAEMVTLVGQDTTLKTSFYDDCKRDRYNPCGLTSSGEKFRPNDADNAASPIYPNGTVLLLRNPANGQAAVVRVNNAGPYWGKRKLDVSRGVAEKLGFKKRGVAKLDVRVIAAPTLAEAKYKKNRRYAPVPGPIGTFASLEQAQYGAMVAMAADTASRKALAQAAGTILPVGADRNPALSSAIKAGTKLASADDIASAMADPLSTDALESPAEGLKAAARRFYGNDRLIRLQAPSSLTAQIAPIHRSRPFSIPN
jgi:rare lipoprotein A